MNLYYVPIDIAAILNFWNTNEQDKAEMLNKVFSYDRNFVSKKYRDKERTFFLNVGSLQQYLYDNSSNSSNLYSLSGDLYILYKKLYDYEVTDDFYLVFYFKYLRIKILYSNTQDYVRVKIKTILSMFGYKRRTAALVEQMKSIMYFYHLTPYFCEEECDLIEVGLDDMITIRADE